MKAQKYRVVTEFWHGPDLMQPGDTLMLTPAQVKYMGAEIALAEAEADPKRPRATEPRAEATE